MLIIDSCQIDCRLIDKVFIYFINKDVRKVIKIATYLHFKESTPTIGIKREFENLTISLEVLDERPASSLPQLYC